MNYFPFMDGRQTDSDLRRLMKLLDARRQPGFGIVISLSDEKEKRAARALLKQRRRPQVTGPGGEDVCEGPDSDDE
jgi:hypothetical protein